MAALRGNGRKRTRPSFLLEDSTPSDPALFSSDPPDPSAEHYFVPRPKKQYRGTWWQNGPQERRARKAFERNMDSGVFMGSDSSYESLDIGVPNSDDTILDDPIDLAETTVSSDATSRKVWRPVRVSEPPLIALARKRIAYFAEDGSFRNVNALDEDLKVWALNHRQTCEDYSTVLSLDNLGLPYLTDDMIKPLQYTIKPLKWPVPAKRLKDTPATTMNQESPDDSSDEETRSLDSETELDALSKDTTLDLSSNALAELPISLFGIPGLAGIDVGNNNLSELSGKIRDAKRLHFLNVVGNRLRWLPAEVADLYHTTEHKRFSLVARNNPLVQPFSYVGLHDLYYQISHQTSQYGSDSESVSSNTQMILNLRCKTIFDFKRMTAQLRALLSVAQDKDGNTELSTVQIRWLLRLYEHFITMPEMIWLDSVGEMMLSFTKEEEDILLARWGTGSGSSDSLDVSLALANLEQKAGRALRHHTFLIGTSPICYMNICGRPSESHISLPSELPLDVGIVSARLLAVPKSTNFRLWHEQVDYINLMTQQEGVKPTSGVRSLYATCLRSAASVPELHRLPELLPDDVSTSVRSGLDMAIQARSEGGRVCSICKRNYIVPRAEWIEYHHIHGMRNSTDDINSLFLPFLRRVCSWACVPHFEYDD